MKNQQGLGFARRLFSWQLTAVVLLGLVFALLWSLTAGWSAVLGGLTCILPSMLFANKLFAQHGAHAARKIVQAFYWGEALKIGLTVLMFCLIFRYLKVNAAAFFMSFMLAQLVIWFAPLIRAGK